MVCLVNMFTSCLFHKEEQTCNTYPGQVSKKDKFTGNCQVSPPDICQGTYHQSQSKYTDTLGQCSPPLWLSWPIVNITIYKINKHICIANQMRVLFTRDQTNVQKINTNLSMYDTSFTFGRITFCAT